MDQRLRQLQREFHRLMAAQPAADHQHRIHGLVEFLHPRRAVAMQPAEGHRMVLGDDPAPVPGTDRAEAELQQRHRLGAGGLGAIAEPAASAASRARGSPPPRPAPPRRAAGRGDRQHQRVELRRARDGGALDVDRDLDADGAHRRGQRQGRGAGQHAERFLRRTHPEGGLRDRRQHRRLARHVVHRAHVAVEVFRGGLAGDVQHRAAGELRLRPGPGTVLAAPGPVEENITPRWPETRA